MIQGKHWVVLIRQFLLGQGAVQLVNVVVGLLLLRILPIEEFALYALALVFSQTLIVASDMGVSHAINTIAAPIRENKSQVGALIAGACKLVKVQFSFAVIVICAIAGVVIFGREWSTVSVSFVIFVIVIVARFKVNINLRRSILNVHHDANGLFQSGIAEAVVRLLILPLCVVWPLAIIALLGNFLGSMAARFIIAKYCRVMINEAVKPSKKLDLKLNNFIKPLRLSILYQSVQGQLSILILGYYGYTSSVAEVGALGRLSQLLGLVAMLNCFLLQPLFSRIRVRREFVIKMFYVLAIIFLFSLVCMITSQWLPGWWLAIIGENYSGLVKELQVALLIALLGVLGATLYTFVISRSNTKGQSWYIVISLTGQVLFLSFYGITSTYQALLLNLVPVSGYVLVQGWILTKLLIGWKLEEDSVVLK